MSEIRKDPEGRTQPISGYEILERIGSGGMGTIFKARQLSMDRIVALKVLKKSTLKDALPLDRLRREALIIARMDHPNVVKGIDMGETERYYFFAMEFVDGRSLKDILDQEGPMEEVRAASIVREVSRALVYADDRKLTHRDIKPGNILVSASGQIKVTDLGLAKGERDLTITREGFTLGTPQYIAPEQARNPKTADIRSDIYSLGATFYHMTTGHLPFDGDTLAEVITKVLFESPPLPESLNSGISRGTSRVISRMMAKDRTQRYASPAELVDDLDVLLESLGHGESDLENLIGMTWRESQKGRWPPLKRLLVGAAAVFLTLLSILFLRPEEEPPLDSHRLAPKDPLEQLQQDYHSAILSPFEALQAFESIQGSIADTKALEKLRQRLDADNRKRVEDLFQEECPLMDRALAEGGFRDGSIRFKRLAEQDLSLTLGCGSEALPAFLGDLWVTELSQALSRFSDRIEADRRSILSKAREKRRNRVEGIEDLLNRQRFDLVGQNIRALEQAGSSLLRESALDYGRQLALTCGKKPLPAEHFLNRQEENRFSEDLNQEINRLEQRLEREAAEAQSAYLEKLRRRAVTLLENADEDLLSQGGESLLEAAAQDPGITPPVLPENLKNRFPGAASLLKPLLPLIESKKIERQARLQNEGRQALLSELDRFLVRGDLAGARHFSLSVSAEKAGKEFVSSWRKRLEQLEQIETSALEAMNRYLGLELTFATRKGVHYQGILQTIDPQPDRRNSRIVLVLGSGQTVTLDLAEIKVIALLDWAGKKQILDPWARGLYAYTQGELEVARASLLEAAEFAGRSWFLSRIAVGQASIDENLRLLDISLKALLEEIEEALKAGDWEVGLEKLRLGRSQYREAPSWGESRRVRDNLQRRLEVLRDERTAQERLARLFSVPVQPLTADRVRVTYDFSTRKELNDFRSVGQAWQVMEGALLCGTLTADEQVDYYHNLVGIRLGGPFDPEEPLNLSFSYQAPVECPGPSFMGISFLGGCLGIRSFADRDYPGQINFWKGDLDDYGDHFFVPDFGEARPVKGKSQSFAFYRGERYRIELIWLPGRELVFRIDGKDLYRVRAFRGEYNGIEVKTLRAAWIDNLVIEGTLKDD